MIANFEQIETVYRENAREISSLSSALGPTVGINNRSTLYDPIWGYYTFGQSTEFVYDETDTYQDITTFTINGIFTKNAEVSLGASDNESSVFNAISAKYQALLELFKGKADAQTPDDFADWGTFRDSRVITLPDPLRDKTGSVIYAFPEKIDVQESQYPLWLRYSANLTESRFYGARAKVNGILLDTAIMDIQVAGPQLVRHEVAAAAGSILQLHHWNNTEVSISGTIPNNSGDDMVASKIKDFIRSTEAGKVSIDVEYVNDNAHVKKNMWRDIDLIESDVDVLYESESSRISLTARE